jgi:hypothetical protein
MSSPPSLPPRNTKLVYWSWIELTCRCRLLFVLHQRKHWTSKYKSRNKLYIITHTRYHNNLPAPFYPEMHPFTHIMSPWPLIIHNIMNPRSTHLHVDSVNSAMIPYWVAVCDENYMTSWRNLADLRESYISNGATSWHYNNPCTSLLRTFEFFDGGNPQTMSRSVTIVNFHGVEMDVTIPNIL